MKSLRWIVVSMFTGLLAAGCAVQTAPAEEEGPAEHEEAAAGGGVIILTTYYDAMGNEVGHCARSTCSFHGGVTCTGIKTPIFDSETTSCQ